MEKKPADNSNQNKTQLEWIKKKPFQKLTNNLYLKIAAVVIAIILWASVQASSDGIEKKKFEIPITYINAHYLDQKDMSLKSYEDTITIEVQAKSSELIHMKDYHFTAIGDLSATIGDDLYRKLVRVKITPHEEIKDSITDLSYKTSEWVSITLESMQTKTFQVEVNTDGELPEEYQISKDGFQVMPATVELRAPESYFSSINKVIVDVSLSKVDDGFINQTVEPIVLDSNGKVILPNDKMTISVNEIQVETELLKSKKIHVIVDGTSGTLADGYQLKDITPEPKEIIILGTRVDLSNVNSVMIPKEELNVQGLTSTKEFAVDITKYLPNTVSLYGDESVIRVTVLIEALDEQSYQIPIDQIEMEGMLDDKQYDILNKNFLVTLRGLEEDLDSLRAEEIEVSVDVSNLNVGINSNVPVEIRVRSGFVVMSKSALRIRMTKIEETTTEAVEEESSTVESSSETE